MRRREFIAGLGVSLLAGAARAADIATIGFLSSRTLEQGRTLVAAIRNGLQEAGFTEGRNAAIEYRWGNGELDRLPALAADLVARKVDVIIAGGTSQSARAATTTIPIVFTTGLDPVAYGLVTSLSRPNGNLTGATFYSGALIGKQMELLRELYPQAESLAMLVKSDSPSAGPQTRDAKVAEAALGRPIEILNAVNESEFDAAFASLRKRPNSAMLVSVDPYFDSHASQLSAVAARHAVPTIYNVREFVAAGGLLSYGASITETYRHAGVYAGRILKGARPADLPIILPTRFDLVVKLRAAKALGLSVPPQLLARADEVIE